MNRPQPHGKWTDCIAAKAYGHLTPGHTYEVCQPFVDYDGIAHPAGECWRFLGHSFLPYDDGLSLFVSKPGSDDEWHVRLQDRAEQQADVIRALHVHVVPVDTTADVDGAAGMLPEPRDLHVSVRLQGWRWLALYGGYGFGVGAILGATVAMITLSNAPAQGALASAQWAGLWIFGCGMPFALLGLALVHATRKRVHWEMLATAMPPGTSTSAVKAFLGTPTDTRTAVAAQGRSGSTWTYRPAVQAGLNYRGNLAIDFDHRQRLIGIKRV